MKRAFAALTLAAVLPLSAHHSFVAEYNSAKPVALTGTIARVDWSNPHIWIYIDTKDGRWGCEGGSPNSLARLGWKKETLRPGDRVTLEGFAARDMEKTCIARTALLPDGRRLVSQSTDAGRW